MRPDERGPRQGVSRRQVASLLARLLLPAGLGSGVSTVLAAHAATRLVEAARRQIGVTVGYDPRYQRIGYPGGDVPTHTGVCTDVVVRAYRELGLDLQVLVHEDMKRAWSHYPRRWGLSRPDPHIDHRRVPNLEVFFTRRKAALPVTREAADYRAGDVVTWMLPRHLPHIGIVSDRQRDGRPLVIHNIGAGTREEDRLWAYPLTGHFRFLPG